MDLLDAISRVREDLQEGLWPLVHYWTPFHGDHELSSSEDGVDPVWPLEALRPVLVITSNRSVDWMDACPAGQRMRKARTPGTFTIVSRALGGMSILSNPLRRPGHEVDWVYRAQFEGTIDNRRVHP